MRRMLPIAALAVLVLTAFPQQAEADLWDWLQEWSGPGPFHTRGNVMVDLCPGSSFDKRRLTSDFDSRENVKCFFADTRLFVNDVPDNFGNLKVTVSIVEAGAAVRIHRSTEVGFGAGVLRFASRDEEHTRFVVTVPRLVIRPALLYGTPTFWQGQPRGVRLLASVVKFYVKGNVIVGRMQGADFGLTSTEPNFDFDVDNDRVFSTGFIFDVSEILREIF